MAKTAASVSKALLYTLRPDATTAANASGPSLPGSLLGGSGSSSSPSIDTSSLVPSDGTLQGVGNLPLAPTTTASAASVGTGAVPQQTIAPFALNAPTDVLSKAVGNGATANYTDAFNTWKNLQPQQTRVSSGVVEQYMPSDPLNGVSGGWQPLPANNPGVQLYNLATQEGQNVKNFVAANGSGAGVSYLKSETAKTNEITRQFKDFLARANEAYALQKDQQSYNAAADNQNIKDNAAGLAGTLGSSMGSYYMPSALPDYSQELAQSIPVSVAPDYQLNGAVGLPGGDGFAASPMTGATNPFASGAIHVPGYATGTTGNDDELIPLPPRNPNLPGIPDMRALGPQVAPARAVMQ